MHGAIFGAYRSPALSFLYLLKNCFKRFRLDMIPDFCDLILTVLELYLRQCHPLVDLSEPEERRGLTILRIPSQNAVFVALNNPVTRDALFFDTKDEATKREVMFSPVTDRFRFFLQPSRCSLRSFPLRRSLDWFERMAGRHNLFSAERVNHDQSLNFHGGNRSRINPASRKRFTDIAKLGEFLYSHVARTDHRKRCVVFPGRISACRPRLFCRHKS